MLFDEVKPLPDPKRSKTEVVNIPEPPSSIICSFISQEGNRAGPSIDLPSISNAKQLEQLVNTLLANTETVSNYF